MKIYFIVNPQAGGFRGFQKLADKAVNQLSKQGYQVECTDTTGAGDGLRLARQAAAQGYDVAVAIGGDGTVNEVCNGLAGIVLCSRIVNFDIYIYYYIVISRRCMGCCYLAAIISR